MRASAYPRTVARRLLTYFASWRGVVAAVAIVSSVLAAGAEAPLARVFAAAGMLSVLLLVGVVGSRLQQVEASREVTKAVAEQPRQLAEPDRGPVTWAIRHQVSPDDALVTVVITSHNDAGYISDCIESVRSQTWEALECLVVDDGSTDRSVELAMDAAGSDPRFSFYQTAAASGVAAARNEALQMARGRYVTFLDADDYLFRRSLESRISGFFDPATLDHPVAGVYCDWVGVEQASLRMDEGRPAHARPRITWTDAAEGAPVINSAPLLRLDVVRAAGGYRDSAAEDADLWNRLLRHGFIFEPVRYTGVAYRQKEKSRFRSSAVAHAQTMLGIARSNREAFTSEVAGAAFVYERPVAEYRSGLADIQRLLLALATAVSAADGAATEELASAIRRGWEPFMGTAIDVHRLLLDAAMRHQAFREHGRVERAEAVVLEAEARLDGLAEMSGVDDLELLGVPPSTATSVREVVARPRVELSAVELGSAIESCVVLMPAVEYHVDEMGALAEALIRRGQRAVFLISDRRWPDVQSAVRWYEVPVFACPDPGPWVGSAKAYVTLNDWGEVYRDVVVEAKKLAVPTFGKVEGVQDFTDADVHWDRRAYETVDHVLCQGENDATAIRSSSKHIVGSTRLEDIWHEPECSEPGGHVVINLNFTYAVLNEARESWLGAAREACELARLPYVISLHPQERPRPDDPHVTEEPMRHLLTKAAALVSRFSTVPFEAMARGVHFVYFNPHGERVPTFQRPNGAFDVAESVADLGEVLSALKSQTESARDRAAAFFSRQISIDPETDSASRAADVIMSIVSADEVAHK